MGVFKKFVCIVSIITIGLLTACNSRNNEGNNIQIKKVNFNTNWTNDSYYFHMYQTDDGNSVSNF